MADRDALTMEEPAALSLDASDRQDADVPYDLEAIFALGRPDRRLLIYYVLFSFILGPLFFLILIPLALRFRTLRYRFDEEGIGMRWGALRRREVDLAYARIQDIHLISNAVERWLGLARIKVQTASGSQKAEVVIEGILDYEPLRSYLVERMRRARRGDLGGVAVPAAAVHPGVLAPDGGLDAEAVSALCASMESAAGELRAIRALLEAGGAGANPQTSPGEDDHG